MTTLFPRAGLPSLAVMAVFAGVLTGVPKAKADDSTVSMQQAQTMQQLVRMSNADLTALYMASPPGSVPSGYTPGRSIKNPGSRRTVLNSRATRLVWQGKIFRDDGTMVNRLFGVGRAIPAEVYMGHSLLDGQPSLIFDYSKSRLWPDVRDEVREVSPGLYLGIMYRGRGQMEQKQFFTLDARK